MSKMNQVYGLGQAIINSLPPPQPFQNAPTSFQTNYEIGQIAYTPPINPTAFYIYAGNGTWEEFIGSSFGVSSITGTANQIAASAPTGAVTLSLIGPYTPATYTAHGVLFGAGTSSIGATAVGTAGQVLTSNGAGVDPSWTTNTFPATATAGALIAATATNVIGQIIDVAVGQVLASGGVGVIPAYTASPSVTGSVTAATGFVSTTAGAGITTNPVVGTPGAGPITATGRVIQATFSSISIASGATQALVITNNDITTSSIFSLTWSGATAGSALSIASAVPTANTLTITMTNGTSATMVTSVANITFTCILLN